MNRHQGVPGLAPKYKKGDQLTESLTKEAIKLIQQHKSESPFFLNFWYYCVHNKHGAHKHLVDKYRDKINQLGIKEEQNRICPVTAVSLHTTPSYPTYAAMIETLDQSVGDIVKTLKQQKKYDNTLFVFFSDNGPVTNQAPCVPLMGGKNSKKVELKSCEVFDPLTNSWTLLEDGLKKKRAAAASVAFREDELLVIGGRS